MAINDNTRAMNVFVGAQGEAGKVRIAAGRNAF